MQTSKNMLLYRLNINPQNMAIEKEVPVAGKVVMRLDEQAFGTTKTIQC